MPSSTNQILKNHKPRIIAGIVIFVVVAGLIATFTFLIRGDKVGKSVIVSNFESVSAKSRDVKRQTDVRTTQTQLESFFERQGYYPSFTDLSSQSWRQANVSSLDPQALTDPSGIEISLVPNPRQAAYAYQVTKSNGMSCESDDTSCTQYKLTATFETLVNNKKTFTVVNL